MSRKSDLIRLAMAIVATLVAVSLAFFLTGYQLFVLTMIGVHTAVALGLNVLTGYSGQISIGHGGLMGIGAYSFALLATKVPALPFIPAILVSAGITAIAGLCLGIPAVRLSGPYLAIVTMGFSLSVPQVLLHFDDLTGGRQGIMVEKPNPPESLASLFNADQWVYLVVILFVFLLYCWAHAITKGRLGRTFLALADSELAAKSVGIHVAKNKVLAFVLSAFFTGVAGALYCGAVGFVSPESFPLMTSVAFLVMIVVGGLRSLPGAFLGAAMITLLPNISSELSKSVPGIIYGVCLVAVVIFFPTGIGGVARSLLGRMNSWLSIRPPSVAVQQEK